MGASDKTGTALENKAWILIADYKSDFTQRIAPPMTGKCSKNPEVESQKS
jgi:hypothetical protein